MKKLLTIGLMLFSVNVLAGVDEVQPSYGETEYVTRDRFVSVDMKNPLDKVITDTKTGCQFIIIYNGHGVATIPLGCFNEFKKK